MPIQLTLTVYRLLSLFSISCSSETINAILFKITWVSIVLITDEIGAVEQSNYFDPWGKERKIITDAGVKKWIADNSHFLIANKPITTRGFTGHEHLAEVGLIHMTKI